MACRTGPAFGLGLLPFLLALSGCPASSDGSPPPASPGETTPTPAQVPDPPPPEASLAPDQGTERQSAKPKYQPIGAPFPLPDPLPEVAYPREVDGPEPHPGLGEIDFWLGGTGTELGQFSYPRAITCSAEGVLYVVDKAGRIQSFSPQGKLLRIVRTPEIGQGKPTGLSLDNRGRLLAADTHYCRVLVYSPQLELLGAWGVHGPNPGQFMFITYAMQGADGRLYTTDYGDYVARVQVWQAEGEHELAFGDFGMQTGQFRRPSSVWIHDARDEIYVADAVNHRIAVFDREGTWLRDLGGQGHDPGQLEFPYHVVIDEEERLWVAEFGNQRVSVLDRAGACLGTWGLPGRALGTIARPWGVALGPDERVWLLDSGNDRVYALKRRSVLGS